MDDACPDYGMSPSPTAGLECATLRVPLDYADASGRTIELTLSRHAGVPGKRRGVLLMNPGGPGSPGLACRPSCCSGWAGPASRTPTTSSASTRAAPATARR
ncbi:hypothetical protein [Amycolatopsis sp. NPDC051371]|uniref:hypothetical protein n=1 Tax=Amycolatopsis sp. NPDC051371 TaxID=3155800 RepID=UPI00342F6560